MSSLITAETGLSYLSVAIAAAAFLHSRKSSRETSSQIAKISIAHLQMAREIAEDEAHVQYATLVSQIELEFEETIRESKKEARHAIEKLVQLLITLDYSENRYSYIDHRFMEAVEETRKAYDFELTFQTGPCLRSELWNPRRLEELSQRNSKLSLNQRLQSLFKNRYNSHPEQRLLENTTAILSSKRFTELASRIDHNSLIIEASEYFWDYTKSHRKISEQLVSMRSRLKDAHKKNSLERFSIEDNTKLQVRFFRLLGDIDRYDNLDIEDLRCFATKAGPSALGLVFAGAVILCVASEINSWGLWAERSDSRRPKYWI